MSSPTSLLLVFLFAVLQSALSVDAKGGGKSSGSKSSKKKPKLKTNPVVFKENGRCYDQQHVEVPCPSNNKTALIIGIVAAVVAVILILVLAIWLFKRRSQKKNKKGLGVKARGIDDASSDHESIVPLVLGETKEKNGDYSYKGANYSVGEARPY